MLTDLSLYFRLPLESHPLNCQECDDFLDPPFIVWKLMSAGEIILCRRCAEMIGFRLWTDALRAEGVPHE